MEGIYGVPEVSICEGRDTSYTSAKNEGMNILGALVCVHCFQVHHMPDHVVFVADAVASQHVPALACNGQSFSTVVPLQQGDHLGHHLALFLQATKLEARVKAKGNLGNCIRQLLLDQLVGCQWPSKLVPAHSVVPGLVNTELGSSEGPPCNSIASVVEARERPLEADHLGQHVLLWDCNLVHEDHAGVGSPQGELALDLWCRKAGHPLLKNEAPQSSLRLGPDHKDISNG